MVNLKNIEASFPWSPRKKHAPYPPVPWFRSIFQPPPIAFYINIFSFSNLKVEGGGEQKL